MGYFTTVKLRNDSCDKFLCWRLLVLRFVRPLSETYLDLRSPRCWFFGAFDQLWGARLLLGFKSRPEGPKSQPAALADVKVFGHSTLEDQLAEGQLVSHARPLLWTEFWVRRPSLRDETGQLRWPAHYFAILG